MYNQQGSLLSNNSAIRGVGGSQVLCCIGNAQNDDIEWLDPSGHSVSTGENNIVNVYNQRNRLVILGDISSFHKGVYKCRYANTTVTELLIGIYDTSIGTPSLSAITLTVVQNYPLLASLSFDSSNFPPTFISWDLSNNCYYSNYSQLSVATSSIYTNVILLSNHQCDYTGTYTCSVSTNGISYTIVNNSLSKSHTHTNRLSMRLIL